MNIQELFAPKRPFVAWIVFCACLLLSLSAFVTASLVQRDFGRVEISNVTYPNTNGILIRAKLFVPVGEPLLSTSSPCLMSTPLQSASWATAWAPRWPTLSP